MALGSSYQIQADSHVYNVVDDCTTTYSALITGAVLDEILGNFYAPGFVVVVEGSRTDLRTKTTPYGLYAVCGYPSQSFPRLSSTSYTIALKLAAPDFRVFSLTITIPQNATFPVIAPAVAMRHLPVRIQGRVVTDATRAPIPGALVSSVDNPISPPAIHTTVLRSPLYFAHANGSSVQQVTMTPFGSATLTQDAGAGTQVLNLTARTGLVTNSAIRLANASEILVEYGVVDQLGPGGANQPGQVFLRNALNRTYTAGAGTSVQFINATPVGAPGTLSADADAGDGVLLATPLPNGATVELEPATPNVEYHEVGAISDGDGYYGIDGMGRVPEIFLQASQGTAKEIVDWFVEYDQAINVVDFRLQP